MARARLHAGPVRIPVPARHGRAAVRPGGGGAGQGKLDRPCRIYAPVGTHETLLAYLVRRLLENGANTSFVNRIADDAIPIDELVADPVAEVERDGMRAACSARRIRAFRCRARCTATRARNSAGIDLADEQRLASLAATLASDAPAPAGARRRCVRRRRTHRRRIARRCSIPPIDATSSATCIEATPSDVDDALAVAQARRAERGRRRRRRSAPTLLERAADLLEARSRSADRARRARGRQDARQRGRRSARGGRLPALLRARRRAPSSRGGRDAAGLGGLHQPVEFSAGDLHRPGRARRSPPATRCSPSRPSRRR